MWIRLYLTWNVEYSYSDDFLSIWAYYLGCLGSISPTCPNAQKYTKTGRWTQPPDDLYPWKRLNLMLSLGFYPLDDFLCISTKDLVYLGQIFLTCPNSCKYTKTGINWPSDGLYIWVRLHLMSNVGLNAVGDFLCVCAHYLGVFRPDLFNLPKCLNTQKQT